MEHLLSKVVRQFSGRTCLGSGGRAAVRPADPSRLARQAEKIAPQGWADNVGVELVRVGQDPRPVCFVWRPISTFGQIDEAYEVFTEAAAHEALKVVIRP